MIQLTCFSLPLDTLMFETVSALAQAEQSLVTGLTGGAKTFSDTFADVSDDPDPVKLDVCVTLMLFLPLLFIPNLINQNHDQVSTDLIDMCNNIIITNIIIILIIISRQRRRSHPT